MLTFHYQHGCTAVLNIRRLLVFAVMLSVGLCEVVPGFRELHAEDKATLMEAAYFDLWLVLCLGCSQVSHWSVLLELCTRGMSVELCVRRR